MCAFLQEITGGTVLKKLIVTMLVFFVATTLLFAGGSGESQTRTLSLAHVFATDHPVHLGALRAKELLEERTDGALSLQIYPNATYAGYDDAVRAVRSGALDLAPVDTAVDFYAPSGVLLGPYTFRDYDHWRAFKRSDVASELKDTISDRMGIQYLQFYQFGFRHATANRPATTPEEFSGLRLRVVDFAPYPEIATVLNARPTAMPIQDVYMALSTGVADGQENPFTQILTMRFYEVQDYLILTGHMMATSGIAMSERAWDNLTAEQQVIVQDVFNEMAEHIDNLVIDNSQEMLEELESLGMTVVEVDIAPFQERTPLVLAKYPEWEELFNAIQDIR